MPWSCVINSIVLTLAIATVTLAAPPAEPERLLHALSEAAEALADDGHADVERARYIAASGYATLGKLEDARRLARQLPESLSRTDLLSKADAVEPAADPGQDIPQWPWERLSPHASAAVAALERGDDARARQHVLQIPERHASYYHSVAARRVLGMCERNSQQAERAEAAALTAHLFTRRNQPDAAKAEASRAHLEALVRYLDGDPTGFYNVVFCHIAHGDDATLAALASLLEPFGGLDAAWPRVGIAHIKRSRGEPHAAILNEAKQLFAEVNDPVYFSWYEGFVDSADGDAAEQAVADLHEGRLTDLGYVLGLRAGLDMLIRLPLEPTK
ncbi:MAG: hypothetical protein AAF561_10210 [Planctomycetota bacterium]